VIAVTLLPTLHPDRTESSRRRLARHAAMLLRSLAADRPPPGWATPRFGREVELVRRHLAPIRTRTLLAASFGREGSQVDPALLDAAAAVATSPTAVAYAIRWLELGDGAPRPTFAATPDGDRWRALAR
jgi:hypothetical protein